MSTDFDTFCMSKHGVFFESMLGVRGCAEEECVEPANAEGACCWEEADCSGCFRTTASVCYQKQRRCEEAGNEPCFVKWTPYHICAVPGWSIRVGFVGGDFFYCGIPELTQRLWESCSLPQGACCCPGPVGPGGIGAIPTTRDLCLDHIGAAGDCVGYHEPYFSQQYGCADLVPCCVYTYHGPHCYELSVGRCDAVGGVVSGEIGAGCDGVSCVSPTNAWGACCSGDGTCTDRIKPEDCYVQSGTLWYACQTCDEASCYNGACCLDDGTCEDGITATACHVLGGLFQGPATTCDDPEVDCVADIHVACCRPDGSCHDSLSRRHCAAADGIVMGALSCADVPACPEEWGACCRNFGEFDAQCHMVHADAVQLDCTDLGGTYMAHGTRCSELNCAEGVGACCKPSGICLGPPNWPNMNRATCGFIDPDNVFIGFGKTCTPFTCDGPVGACCSIHGHGLCNETPEGACDSDYGIWQGAGSTCNFTICPETIGACCRRDRGCHLTWIEECEFHQGIGAFQGAGVSCDDVDCGPDSSCCLPDGSCITTGLKDCRARGGAWTARPPGWPAWNCFSTSCNSGLGACCVSERCHEDIEYQNCIDAGGKFFGDDTRCSWAATNCTPGACCLPDGSCEYWTQAWCENRGGEWHGSYGDFFVNCRGHDGTDHAHDYDCSE